MQTALPEEILENIERYLSLQEDYLKKIASTIVTENISQYPIFVIHREAHIAIGKAVLAAAPQSEWAVNVSFLEEFVRRKLLQDAKITAFKNAYQDVQRFMCVFVIFGEANANFLFYPYHDEA